jgi:hypothetical protein
VPSNFCAAPHSHRTNLSSHQLIAVIAGLQLVFWRHIETSIEGQLNLPTHLGADGAHKPGPPVATGNRVCEL